MSKSRIQELSIKFTNNCTQIGILESQMHAAQVKKNALLAENGHIEAEHIALSKMLKAVEAEAKVASSSKPDEEKKAE